MSSIFPEYRPPWIDRVHEDPEGTVNALLDLIDTDRAKICKAIDANTVPHPSKWDQSKAIADALFGRG